MLNSSTDEETGNFINTLFTDSVLPMITQPTRYRDQSATLIDNVITNKYLRQHLSGILLNDFSDHFQIFFVTGDISFKCQCHSGYFMKKVRLVSENHLNCFEEKIRNAFLDMLNENNVDRAYDKFYNLFHHLYNEALPVKNKKIKHYHNKYKPWITHGILNSVYEKSRL